MAVVKTEILPLALNADSIWCVGGTRVTLDTIVEAFKEGATAEEIAQQYPAVNLSDVYSVIGYYLKNQPEVDTYLQKRTQERSSIRKRSESQFDPQGIRVRLLAKRAGAES